MRRAGEACTRGTAALHSRERTCSSAFGQLPHRYPHSGVNAHGRNKWRRGSRRPGGQQDHQAGDLPAARQRCVMTRRNISRRIGRVRNTGGTADSELRGAERSCRVGTLAGHQSKSNGPHAHATHAAIHPLKRESEVKQLCVILKQTREVINRTE